MISSVSKSQPNSLQTRPKPRGLISIIDLERIQNYLDSTDEEPPSAILQNQIQALEDIQILTKDLLTGEPVLEALDINQQLNNLQNAVQSIIYKGRYLSMVANDTKLYIYDPV